MDHKKALDASWGLFYDFENIVKLRFPLYWVVAAAVRLCDLDVQVCRIVWGLLYDRFGYKRCVIFIGTCVTLGVSGLPLLKYLGDNTLLTYDSSSPRLCDRG